MKRDKSRYTEKIEENKDREFNMRKEWAGKQKERKSEQHIPHRGLYPSVA
jgi:hypothetical protein